MNPEDLLRGLPGEDLVRQGLADFRAGRRTVPACLVSLATIRLRRLGVLTEADPSPMPEPEQTLYRLLRAEGGDAYARYNALLREFISFEQALEQRRFRAAPPPAREPAFTPAPDGPEKPATPEKH